MTKYEMLCKFRDEVCMNKALNSEDSILADSDWFDMSLGYFLALGASPDCASELALEARYKKQYWS